MNRSLVLSHTSQRRHSRGGVRTEARRRLRRAIGLAAGSLLIAPSLVFAAGSTTSGATMLATPGTHMVPTVLAGLPLAKVLGPAPASQDLRVGVSLSRPNSSGEIALYHQLYDPSSPRYRHFLTPTQFEREFGVPSSQATAVRKWLTSAGLSIETTSAAGDYFTASGTVAQLDKLFEVSIRSYSFNGRKFLANDVPPSVPNDLPVDAVIGLDTVRKFSLSSLNSSSPATISASGSGASALTKSIGTSIASAPEGTRIDLGQGQTLGILGEGGTSSVVGQMNSPPPATTEGTSVGPQSGTEGVLTPQDLWAVYNDPGASALTNSNGTRNPSTLESTHIDLGQGQTMGIFGEGETSSVVGQLRLFEQAMGFPKIPVRTIQTEGGPNSAYGDNTGAIEWYLDSQSSTGMSPDASQLDFYFAKSLFDADILKDFDYWANDPHGPRQMNASFGECEQNPTNPITGPLAQTPYGTEFGDELEAASEPMLRQATIEGRTLFSSSGDTGSGCPELVAPGAGAGNGVAIQPVPEVNYPCASAYAVCVGGTVVSTNGATYPTSAQRSEETSWTFGGGGTSYYIPEPGYQVGVANVSHACISTPTGDPYSPASAPTCRGVPDVSDMSGNVTGDGYFIYIDGEPSSQGGTSLSSPLMMGQWTRIQAAASAKIQKGGGLGFANETIYHQAKSADACSSSSTASCSSTSYARDFFDVTQSEYGTGNGAYQPGPGWDYASGWGSLNVANFAQDVDGSTNATCIYGATEKAAATVTEATMTSPTGNATDPVDVSLGNDPALDLTQATLTASASKGVVATLSGPSIGALPPPDATNGASFFVAWLSNTGGKVIVYYARANESPQGTWTFTSGQTGTYGQSSTYGYNDTASSAATGSVNTDTGTITIDIPASEVGSPKAGSLLLDPQAFDQILVGTPAVWLALTTDSSDNLTAVSHDGGASVSKGLAVQVGS